MSDDALEYNLLVARALEELRNFTAMHDRLFKLSEAAWNFDQTAQTITFTSPDGIQAVCRLQIVGTYNTADRTWLWGWDHPSVDAPLREHAQKVREYGIAHHLARLTTRNIACDESEAWTFAALACKLGGGQGAYRAPAGATLVFVTYSDVTISKVSPA